MSATEYRYIGVYTEYLNIAVFNGYIHPCKYTSSLGYSYALPNKSQGHIPYMKMSKPCLSLGVKVMMN